MPPYEARMRRCSRSSAGSLSAGEAACGTGSETCLMSGMLVQPANNMVSASASPRRRFAVVSVAAMASVREFDLLGLFGRDHRGAALLDALAHPDVAAFKLFGLDAGRGEGALQTAQ